MARGDLTPAGMNLLNLPCYEILHQLSNLAVVPGQYSIHTILDPWLEFITNVFNDVQSLQVSPANQYIQMSSGPPFLYPP